MKIIIFILLFHFSHSILADNLKEHAHAAGFIYCDTAISEEFSQLVKHKERQISTGFFNSRSFNIMASWGKQKNSIWKNTTLIKFGRQCLAYSVVGSIFPESCEAFKSKQTKHNILASSIDFQWIKNDHNIDILLKGLTGGQCSVTYRTYRTYSIDIPKKAMK